jgi:hypothetical protein
VSFDSKERMIVNPKAIEFLEGIQDQIGVIGVAGNY